MTLEERFWAKVDKDGPVPIYRPDLGPCWLWTATDNGLGYGRFWDGSRLVYPYRWSYERLVGPIPAGLTIDHLCRVPACVNPAHLEPVTKRVNTLRGESFIARKAEQTHCIHGHEFTASNVRLIKNGTRRCKACERIRASRYYHERRRRVVGALDPVA